MTLPQTVLQKTDNSDKIHISSTPSSEDEESKEQVEVAGEDDEYGGSRFANPEAPLSENLEFDEAEAFKPDEDTRVYIFNNSITQL